MRVLHVGKFYPPHKGGIETYLESLCRELKSSVALDVVVSADDRRSHDEVVDGVPVRRLPTWFTFSSAAIGPGLVRAIRKSPADIVHLHFPNPVAVLSWLASGHQGRLVVSYHSDIVRQKMLGAVFAPFLRAALRRASAIISASPNYIESSPVLREFQERCVMIPYGVTPEDFEAVDADQVAVIRASAGPRLILAVGRLVGYKGFEYLIRAMAAVDAHLILIGDGPLRENLLAEALKAGAGEKIHFAGEVADLRPYLQAADVFVLPSISRAEAFGIVQLEAMACGKPVVNTNLDSGVGFVSVNGETGLSVPPRDPAALAAAVNRLLDDADLRARFGSAAKERVMREFTVEHMARRTLRLYESILSVQTKETIATDRLLP